MCLRMKKEPELFPVLLVVIFKITADGENCRGDGKQPEPCRGQQTAVKKCHHHQNQFKQVFHVCFLLSLFVEYIITHIYDMSVTN